MDLFIVVAAVVVVVVTCCQNRRHQPDEDLLWCQCLDDAGDEGPGRGSVTRPKGIRMGAPFWPLRLSIKE